MILLLDISIRSHLPTTAHGPEVLKRQAIAQTKRLPCCFTEWALGSSSASLDSVDKLVVQNKSRVGVACTQRALAAPVPAVTRQTPDECNARFSTTKLQRQRESFIFPSPSGLKLAKGDLTKFPLVVCQVKQGCYHLLIRSSGIYSTLGQTEPEIRGKLGFHGTLRMDLIGVEPIWPLSSKYERGR
jgi:hypothetical protein